MKRSLIFTGLIVIIFIFLNGSPTCTHAFKKGTLTFINDTKQNHVISFKYESLSIAPLVHTRMKRLIWLPANTTITIKLKHYFHKYVRVVPAQEYQKVHSGQTVNLSTLCNSLVAPHTQPENTTEEAKKLIHAKKSILKKKQNPPKQGSFEFAVIAPHAIRKNILMTGLKNQYQSGSSRGLLNADRRKRAEAKGLSMSVYEYQQIPHDILPKYGMVFSKTFFFYSHHKLKSPYGEDIYLLKYDHFHDRLTWTLGSPLYPKDTKGFIPWDVKIPHASKSVKRYQEFQIWGPVSPQDIHAFIFTKTPPDRELKTMLTQYGIEIYDGRNGCPVSRYLPTENAM